MTDLLAAGLQLPDVGADAVPPAEYEQFLRVYFRGNELYGVDHDGVEHFLGSKQQVFLSEPSPLPNHPALVFSPVVIDGETVYVMQVNQP